MLKKPDTNRVRKKADMLLAKPCSRRLTIATAKEIKIDIKTGDKKLQR